MWIEGRIRQNAENKLLIWRPVLYFSGRYTSDRCQLSWKNTPFKSPLTWLECFFAPFALSVLPFWVYIPNFWLQMWIFSTLPLDISAVMEHISKVIICFIPVWPFTKAKLGIMSVWSFYSYVLLATVWFYSICFIPTMNCEGLWDWSRLSLSSVLKMKNMIWKYLRRGRFQIRPFSLITPTWF